MNGKSIMRFKNVYIPKEYKLNLFAEYRMRSYAYMSQSQLLAEHERSALQFLVEHELMHIDYKNFCNAKRVGDLWNYSKVKIDW